MAKVIRQDHVEVRLVSASQNLSGHFQLGVHFKIDPEWHVYWKNPGDSGSAPKFQLSGGEIKSIQWPYPVRLPVGDLTNYGYDHEVVFLLDVHTVSAPLKLNLEWLVCKVECIPGFGEIEITEKNVSVEPDLVSKFQRRIPQKGNWKARFDSKSSEALNFEFDLTENEISKIKNIFVFPENSEAFQTGLPKVEPLQKSLKVSVPISSNANFQSKTESFTFVVHDLNDEVRTFFQEIPVQKPPPSIFLGMLFAFLGGVILNLMPCVFPVLFLKAFSFLKEKDTAAIRKSSWQYSLGVVVSFLAFGGLLVILRFSGEAIGWGYQLQNPWLVYLLSLLFFVMGLNFYGFFEVGNNLVLQASKVSGNKFFSGSFGTGVLAVIVASPCTAPFMGSALGLALLLPAHLSILIFLSLGVGIELLEELTNHRIDVIISNSPAPSLNTEKLLAKCVLKMPLIVAGSPKFQSLSAQFPKSLQGQPFIYPTIHNRLRPEIEEWFTDTKVVPNVVAEVQDTSLVKNLALDGRGMMVMAESAIQDHLDSGQLNKIGTIKGLQEEIWLIAVQRKKPHPIVQELMKNLDLK